MATLWSLTLAAALAACAPSQQSAPAAPQQAAPPPAAAAAQPKPAAAAAKPAPGPAAESAAEPSGDAPQGAADPKVANRSPVDPTLASASTPSGRLAPQQIRAVVRANFQVFEQCYKAGLAKDPKLAGRVKVRLVIGRDGRVSSAAVQEQTLPDEAVAQCIVEGFGTLAFPRPEGGSVTVIYPIVLATE